ncbi:hypothetical protein LX32DRAFT_657869 [Colletotrichum zoysiae]|uniref:Uncharacterized protein n=1 Tax=Colletotrichum zoysiae TaxID=1216348 RepID=A0AAD9H5M5_9PEZI|nr:hypothetical protein LX32DRAFT_657869 [Colletotrichum zoysiae]
MVDIMDAQHEIEFYGREDLSPEYDLAGTEAAVREPGNSNEELGVVSSIKPKRFTVMAACDSGGRAVEISVDDKPGGAFTHTLLNQLEQDSLNDKPIDQESVRGNNAMQIADLDIDFNVLAVSL